MNHRDLRQWLPARPATVPSETVAAVAALAFVCMALAALAGWGVGRVLRSPAPSEPDSSRGVTLGLARLQVPSTWKAIEPASARIPGFDSTLTRAFRIDDGLAQHAFVTLSPPTNPRLIPASLQRALRPPIGAPAITYVAGYRAWSYAGIATARANVVMRLTVLPTTAGVLAVACTSGVVVVPSECEQDVAQLSVAPASVLRPTRETAFNLMMSPVLSRLHDSRVALKRDLDAARDAGAQAKALRGFGSAYATAARELEPFVPRHGLAAGLLGWLNTAATAYRAAATAASAGAYGDYFAAREAVTAAEARVAKALARVG